MVTMAPLPRPSALLAAAALPRDEAAAAAPWRRDGDQALWFSRSAFALAALVHWARADRERETPVLWLPGYFCNQSSEPARRAGAHIVHYPIGEDLSPDWAACRRLAEQAPPDLFVLVHYFGRPADGVPARGFCDERGAALIEDAAHVLRPEGTIGTQGDFTFYSPHKWLAVPDGAVLAVRDAARAIAVAGAARQLGEASPSPLNWLIRRLVQCALPESMHATAIRKRTPAFDSDPPFRALRQRPTASRLGLAMLARAASDIAAEAEARHRNAAQWAGDLDGVGRPFLVPGDWTPYRYVLDAGSQAEAAAVYRRLADRGCPVESWPDLAPEVLADAEVQATAIGLRRRLVFLPVHGGVGFMDIRRWTA